MCGIAGIFQPPGTTLSSDLLDVMGRTTEHRGPDNFGKLVDGNMGFAHNRLSLLDLSDKANQPFRDGRYILVYNGEIYNFREIRDRLSAKQGVMFRTTSDTEVLFQSLINYGIDQCLQQLKGMFAFAFFDKKTNELILARDRFGVKPLYYFNDASGFYWASETKVLAKALDIRPDPVKTLFAVGGLGERSKKNTLFRGVYAVEPGTYLRFGSCREVRHTRYYDTLEQFDFSYYKELEQMNSEKIVSEFERLFRSSVEQMLISDAPIGALFSGGVDSSLIAAVARSFSPDLKLFISDIVGKYSELENAKTVAAHLNTELYTDKFEPDAFLNNWAESTYYYESPIVVHTNAIPLGKVARLVKETGVKAVLTGEGADELFLGYPKLLTQRYRSTALLPNSFLRWGYKLVPGLSEYLFPPNHNLRSFVSDLAQNFESQQLDDYCEKFASFNGRKKKEQMMSVKMINEHLITLLHRNDRMGMMASIEARFPFLDEDLVKFAINLPSKFKIALSAQFHNYKHPFLIDKWIVRRLAEKYLPKKSVYKKKFGFGLFAHKNLKILPAFFKEGWLAEVLNWDKKTVDYFTETQDPYFVAKMASVEIFGRIYDRKESIESVRSKILNQVNLKAIPLLVLAAIGL